MSHASWLSELMNPEVLFATAQKISDRIFLDEESLGINAIAVRGISGAVMGAVVSTMTNIPLVIVRKSDHSHSAYHVELPEDIYDIHYVIVDDLISSGETIASMYRDIKRERQESYLEKIYMYHDDRCGAYEIRGFDKDGNFDREKKLFAVPIWSVSREEK